MDAFRPSKRPHQTTRKAQRDNAFDNYTYRKHDDTVTGTVVQATDPGEQVRRGEGGEEKKGEGG